MWKDGDCTHASEKNVLQTSYLKDLILLIANVFAKIFGVPGGFSIKEQGNISIGFPIR